MQCSNCYDEELHGIGINRVVKRVHLQMEEVTYKEGYTYYQCPRCMSTRKQKVGFFSNGLIETASSKEVEEASKNSSGGSGIGAAIGIGAAALLLGAIIVGSNDTK